MIHLSCCSCFIRLRISRAKIWQNLAEICELYVWKNFSSCSCSLTVSSRMRRTSSIFGLGAVSWSSSFDSVDITEGDVSRIASFNLFRFFFFPSDIRFNESLRSAFMRLFVRIVEVILVFQPPSPCDILLMYIVYLMGGIRQRSALPRIGKPNVGNMYFQRLLSLMVHGSNTIDLMEMQRNTEFCFWNMRSECTSVYLLRFNMHSGVVYLRVLKSKRYNLLFCYVWSFW